MARKAQFPPKITRHHTGQARCHWKGRDYYLGPFGSDAAQAAYAGLLAEIGGPEALPARPVLTVAGAVALFLEHQGPTYNPAGGEFSHVANACKPLLRLYATLPAAEVGPVQLEALQQAMAHGTWLTEKEKADWHRKGLEGWCASNTNRNLARVKGVWRWLERKGHVPPGTYAGLKAVPRLRKRDRTVRHAPRRQASTRQELDLVLPHVQRRQHSRPVAAMLELQWLAGMRSCEVRLMRPCDVDREGPEVEGVKVWLYRPCRHKTQYLGHDRVIALGPACQRLLAPWLLGAEPEGYLFRPTHGPYRGVGPYTANGYARCVAVACERAGVKLQPYCGRHAAKERVKRACGLDAARAFLGQVSIDVTNSYGTQADQQTAAQVAARLA